MVYDFHKDIAVYFEQQRLTAREYILPFMGDRPPGRVLEIGCGEGGVLKAFLNAGWSGVGVELDHERVERAGIFLRDEITNGNARIVSGDILQVSSEDLGGPFDLIVLKDVIEHLHDRPAMMNKLMQYLTPQGAIFFGFPPWQMPFGGHQQICQNRLAARLPYMHLLPMPMYRGLLKLFGESDQKIAQLLEIKETGLSIEGFEKLLRQTGYRVDARLLYLINPIYLHKFGLKPRKQLPIIGTLPWLRNFYTTAVYYLAVPAQS